MSRKLASIQKIIDISPISGADNIEVATILGWKVVIRKNEFKINDFCIFVEIDSILPEKPEFEFLRSRKFTIKTIKLKGQISQGIAFPLSILLGHYDKYRDYGGWDEGKDLTEELGIILHDEDKEKEENIDFKPKSKIMKFLFRFKIIRKLFIHKIKKERFPSFIKKTDEMRIQSMKYVLNNDIEKYIVTEKIDGTSTSYFYNKKKFGVCSRNLEIKNKDGGKYWSIVEKYDIENKLKNLKRNIAVQGELLGPGVCKNKYKLNEFKFYVYNVFDINNEKYFSHDEMVKFCNKLSLETVPIIGYYKFNTIDEWLVFASGNSIINNEIIREGIVCRDPLGVLRNRISFKVINNQFLLEYDSGRR